MSTSASDSSPAVAGDYINGAILVRSVARWITIPYIENVAVAEKYALIWSGEIRTVAILLGTSNGVRPFIPV